MLALAACGGSDAGSGAKAAATQGGFTPPKAQALQALGQPEGEVNVLAWPGYVEDGTNDKSVDWVSDFEKTSGCKVNVKTFGTSDEAVQAHAHRPVRRDLGVRRRDAAAHRGR
nr:hypothetical protein [Angustibacter aerolatus]